MDERRLQIIIEARNKTKAVFTAIQGELKAFNTQIRALRTTDVPGFDIKPLKAFASEVRGLSNVLGVFKRELTTTASGPAAKQLGVMMYDMNNRLADLRKQFSGTVAAPMLNNLAKQFRTLVGAAKDAGASMTGLPISVLQARDAALQSSTAMQTLSTVGQTTFITIGSVAAGASRMIATSFKWMAGQVIGYFNLIRGMVVRLISVAGIFAGIAAFKGMLGAAAQMERYHAVLEALTGSYAEAGRIITWVRDKAKETPFEVPGLIEMVTQLKSVGLSYKKWFEPLGNLAMMSGRSIEEGLDAATRAVARLKAGVTGEAMELLRRLKITREDFKKFGVGFTTGGELVGGPKKAIEALYQIIQTKFPGVMKKMEGTAAVAFSNIKDYVRDVALMIAGIGYGGEVIKGGAFAQIRDSIKDALKWVDANRAKIASWSKDVGTALVTVFNWLKERIPAIAKFISDMGIVIGNIIKLIALFIQGLFGTKTATNTVGSALQGIVSTLKAVSQFMIPLAKTLGFVARFVLPLHLLSRGLALLGVGKAASKMVSFRRTIVSAGFGLYKLNAAIRSFSIVSSISLLFDNLRKRIRDAWYVLRSFGAQVKILIALGWKALISPWGIILAGIMAVIGGVILLKWHLDRLRRAAEKAAVSMPTSPVTHETPWRDEAQRTAREAYQRRKQYELEARETLHARWGKALGWGPEKIREKVSSDPVVIHLRGLVKNLKTEIKDRDKVTKDAKDAIEKAYEAAHAPMLEKQKAEFAAEYADYYKALYGDTSKEYEKSLKQQLKVLKDYYTARHALYMKEIPGTKKWGERGIEVMKIAEEGAEIKKALQDIYEKRVKIQEDAAKKLLDAQKKAYDSEIDALKEHLDKMNWLISTAGKMYDLTGNVDYLKNQLAVAKKLRADARSVMGEIPKRSATAENRMWKSITAMQERYEQARRKGAPEEAKNISAEIENAYTEISNIRKEGSKAWRAAVDQFFDAQSTINKITAEIGAVIPLENIERVLDDARANLGLVKEASDSMGAVRAATMGVISAEQEKLKVLEASVAAYEKLEGIAKAAEMRTEIIKTKTEILALQKSMRGNLEDEFKKLAQMVINAPANLEKILATSGISYWNKWFQAKRNALLGMQPAYAGIGGQGAQNINFRFYFDGEEVFPTKRVQEIADGRIRQNQRQ